MGFAPPQLLAMQSTAGNQAVTRMIQREVRIGNGATKPDAAYYKTGAGKKVGSKRKVSSLMKDPVKRIFTDQTELENYANGTTDYIGDVKTGSKETFWYRLPANKLTVLGEAHHDKDGNVEDVIKGLNTKRFKYEPFNELVPTTALSVPTPGTQKQLDKANKNINVAGQVDRAAFNPDLENIVFKALAGSQIARNEYIPLSDADRAKTTWKKRKNKTSYSGGERAALYLAMAIHIAQDISKHTFPAPVKGESPIITAGRDLKATYLAHQAALDTFMKKKDKDQLIAIYELTKPNNFANIPAIKAFTNQFHLYGSHYIRQLGVESGSAPLEAAGDALVANPGAGLSDLSPAREEIMWQKIQGAAGFLLVGMGDTHRQNLKPRLEKAGIPHAFVAADLRDQRDANDRKWTP